MHHMDMGESDDYIYITRVQNGDRDCYAFLVNKYKNMAYTIAFKIMHNTEDAEDAAQEAFIKAYEQLRGFKKESKFSTWLYTIVYRTALYNLRRKAVNNQKELNAFQNQTSDTYSTSDTKIEYEDHQQIIKAAINRLPETESLIITLFYINESSIAEIKQITGLSEGNIKVKLFRARKKLKKELVVLLGQEISYG